MLLVIAWCFELEGLDGMVLLLLDSFWFRSFQSGFRRFLTSSEEWPNYLEMSIGMTVPLWFCVEVNYDNAWPKQSRDHHVQSQTWRALKRQNKSSWILHTPKTCSRDTIPKNRPLKQLCLQKRSHVFFPVMFSLPFFLESVQLFGYHENG